MSRPGRLGHLPVSHRSQFRSHLRSMVPFVSADPCPCFRSLLTLLAAYRPVRVIPVIGPSRPDQLDSAIAAVTTPMSAAAVAALDARSRRLGW